MSKDTFIYNYSAKENAEVQAIRKKYMPADENSIEELRRLDALVQNAGVMEALIAGVGGMMIFGLGTLERKCTCAPTLSSYNSSNMRPYICAEGNIDTTLFVWSSPGST